MRIFQEDVRGVDECPPQCRLSSRLQRAILHVLVDQQPPQILSPDGREQALVLAHRPPNEADDVLVSEMGEDGQLRAELVLDKVAATSRDGLGVKLKEKINGFSFTSYVVILH
jgi:hypothetical protein